MTTAEKTKMTKYIKFCLSTGNLSDIQKEAINITIKYNNLIID